MQAGPPVKEENFDQIETEGIKFYVQKELLGKKLDINWGGFWIFGDYVVKLKGL